MRVFEIEERSGQLVLTKRPLSQRAGLFYSLGTLAFLGWCFWLSLQELLQEFTGFASILTALGILSLFLYVIFRVGSLLLDVLRGAVWVIDMEKQVIKHNGEVLAALNQIYSVRIWEKHDEDSSMRRLALQPTGTKPLVLSDAYTNEEWEELKGIAQRISDFTGIKIVHQ